MPNVRRRSRLKARRRREESITDVKIIRNVNLCHGRNHPQSNVKNAEAI